MRTPRLAGGLAVIALALASLHGVGRAEPARAESASAEPAMDISHRDGLVTLSINDVPLSDVLQAIGREMGVKVDLRGNLTSLIDAELADVPLDEAIKRLARGHSVCLLYGAPRRDGGAGLMEAWVIESRPGTTVARRPEAAGRSAVALDGRASRAPRPAVATLTRMLLDDPSPAVRAQAATELLRLRDASATSALVTASRRDASTNVRRLAIRGLAALRTNDAWRAVEMAFDDHDPNVRAEAERALRRRER